MPANFRGIPEGIKPPPRISAPLGNSGKKGEIIPRVFGEGANLKHTTSTRSQRSLCVIGGLDASPRREEDQKQKSKRIQKNILMFGKTNEKNRIEKKKIPAQGCQNLDFLKVSLRKPDSAYFFLIRILMSIQALRGMSPWGWLAGWLGGWIKKTKSCLNHQNPDQKKQKKRFRVGPLGP